MACAFRRSASLFDDGKQIFFGVVVVGKARAHESAARTILFVRARLDSFTSPACGRGRERSERERDRRRRSEPSGSAPSSRPSSRVRGEGVRTRREAILFIRPRAQRGGGGPRDSAVEGHAAVCTL
jgi:hypothetical protein